MRLPHHFSVAYQDWSFIVEVEVCFKLGAYSKISCYSTFEAFKIGKEVQNLLY